MSHTVTIPHTITSIECLEKAVNQLAGLEFRRDKKSFKSYEKTFKCSHAIGLKKASGYGYEVGVVEKEKKGEFSLKFDSFDSALAEVVGYNCQHLVQGYAAQIALQELPFGWDYTQEKQSNGDLIVEMSH